MKLTIVYTSAAEIKAAIDNGVRVWWAYTGRDPAQTGYEVIKGKDGTYNIVYLAGTPHANAIGLTWRDGTTLNGKAEEFFSVVEA